MKTKELQVGENYRYIGGQKNLCVEYLGVRAGKYRFAPQYGFSLGLTEKSVENLIEKWL
jgi:hypothetical protein